MSFIIIMYFIHFRSYFSQVNEKENSCTTYINASFQMYTETLFYSLKYQAREALKKK